MPIARTRPNSESVFSEKPKAWRYCERADERHRNRDERNDRRAPRLQEEDDDHHDEDRRLEDRFLNFPHRLRDELRRVVDNVVVESARELRAETRHQRFHAPGRRERVRARALKDGHGHRWLVVEIGIGRVVNGTKLDAPDVTHAYESPFVSAFDQHVPELGGVGETPEQLDADLVGPLWRRRRTIQHAAGDLHVLTAKRLHDLASGQAQRGDSVGIEPDPHRVFARAEQPQIADAIEPGQPIADVEQRVIR